ncbi:hypothetical protein Tco_1003263 [Tanacetum coccineum]|uniref:Uncharacterized protein n=1 Tax=Tanacetum coccineum TaxID=301880 RepID=A0ABQ5F9Z6_9ASTR
MTGLVDSKASQTIIRLLTELVDSGPAQIRISDRDWPRAWSGYDYRGCGIVLALGVVGLEIKGAELVLFLNCLSSFLSPLGSECGLLQVDEVACVVLHWLEVGEELVLEVLPT